MKRKMMMIAAMAIMSVMTMSAQGPMRGERMSPQHRVDAQLGRMTRQLNLTEEQQNKVREILTDEVNYEAQVYQLLEERKLAAKEKINSVLTDEQKAKLQHGGHRNGEGCGAREKQDPCGGDCKGDAKKVGDCKGDGQCKKDGQCKGDCKKDGQCKGDCKKDGQCKGDCKKDGQCKGDCKKDGQCKGDCKK